MAAWRTLLHISLPLSANNFQSLHSRLRLPTCCTNANLLTWTMATLPDKDQVEPQGTAWAKQYGITHLFTIPWPQTYPSRCWGLTRWWWWGLSSGRGWGALTVVPEEPGTEGRGEPTKGCFGVTLVTLPRRWSQSSLRWQLVAARGEWCRLQTRGQLSHGLLRVWRNTKEILFFNCSPRDLSSK